MGFLKRKQRAADPHVLRVNDDEVFVSETRVRAWLDRIVPKVTDRYEEPIAPEVLSIMKHLLISLAGPDVIPALRDSGNKPEDALSVVGSAAKMGYAIRRWEEDVFEKARVPLSNVAAGLDHYYVDEDTDIDTAIIWVSQRLGNPSDPEARRVFDAIPGAVRIRDAIADDSLSGIATMPPSLALRNVIPTIDVLEWAWRTGFIMRCCEVIIEES